MDAVTYPNPKVIEFFEQYLAPVRVIITSEPLPEQFRIEWTPTLVILDSNGKEHYRETGFLPPEELIPALKLGIAKSLMNNKKYPEAIALLDRIPVEYPESAVAPEAIYYKGVSNFKMSNDLKDMKRALEILKSKYKGSEWIKRASVYESV